MLKPINHVALLALAAGSLMPEPAMAYIGPGAGLGAIAFAVALVLGVLLLLVGLVWYPLKRLIKGRKNAISSEAVADGSE